MIVLLSPSPNNSTTNRKVIFNVFKFSFSQSIDMAKPIVDEMKKCENGITVFDAVRQEKVVTYV